MRNPERIKSFLETLEKAWLKVPDWRFGQFMINFLGGLQRDPFFYEDDELKKIIEEKFDLDTTIEPKTLGVVHTHTMDKDNKTKKRGDI